MPMMEQERMRMREGPETEMESENPMIYLTPEQLGGQQVTVGDTITLKATDVDKESGEICFEIAGGGSETKSKPGGYEADFEEAIPPSEE